MKLPIIVSEHGDIMMFSSQEEVCSYLEPIDVENGEYIAYDADGFLLNIYVSENKKSFMGFVKITKPKVTIDRELGENRSSELFQKLLNFSRSANVSDVNHDSDLSEIIETVRKFLSKRK